MTVLSVFLPRCLAAACLAFAASAPAQTVTLTELPTPAGHGVAGVANIASDGTVVGTAYPSGEVVRWVPGEAAEVLGGDTYTLDNVMPFVSKDGAVIVASNYFDDYSLAAPGFWLGGTDWERASGMILTWSTPYGMSWDGAALAGGGYNDPPPGQFAPIVPWIWTLQSGQQLLDLLPGTSSGQAWAVADDASVAAGFIEDGGTRYGVRWEAGTPAWITDLDGERVGQALACNADCSVIVGAGIDNAPAGVAHQAWRWTADEGPQYLGTVPGGDPSATYYAFESTRDGSMVVGSYFTIDPMLGALNRGFLWTRDEGMQDMTTWLAAHGIDYGADFSDLVVNAITPDGDLLLINGTDADYMRQRAVVRIVPEEPVQDFIFSDGFEGFGPL